MIHSVLRRGTLLDALSPMGGTLHDPLSPKGGTLHDPLSPEDRDVA